MTRFDARRAQLAEEIARIDWVAFESETFARLVHEVNAPHGDVVEVPVGRAAADRASARRRWLGPVEDDLVEELTLCRQQAEEGDAASARRVAEILEIQDKVDDAAAWWQRAAAGGDPDAQLYVRDVLQR